LGPGRSFELQTAPDGHQYFTLKDARAQIACVIWRDAMAPLRQPLGDGAHVQVFGTVSVFEARGAYQLSGPNHSAARTRRFAGQVRSAQAQLEARAFRIRRGNARCRNFEAHRNCHLAERRRDPRYLNVLRRRAPWLQILISPVRVQGSGAAQEIAVAIRELTKPNENFAPVDLIVVTRAAEAWRICGSSTRRSSRATIADLSVPIVSAIGHESILPFAISWPICGRPLERGR